MAETRDLDALVEHVREYYGPKEWLYNLETWQRQMIATTAAAKHGTTPVPPTTQVVRTVYARLKQPASVLLGLGTCECGDELDPDSGWCFRCDCVYCGQREVDGRCPDDACEGSVRRPTSLNRFGGRNR